MSISYASNFCAADPVVEIVKEIKGKTVNEGVGARAFLFLVLLEVKEPIAGAVAVSRLGRAEAISARIAVTEVIVKCIMVNSNGLRGMVPCMMIFLARDADPNIEGDK